VLAVTSHLERADVCAPIAHRVEQVFRTIQIEILVRRLQGDLWTLIPAVDRTWGERGLRHGQGCQAAADIVFSSQGLVGSFGFMFELGDQAVAFRLFGLNVPAARETACEVWIADTVVDSGLWKWAQRTGARWIRSRTRNQRRRMLDDYRICCQSKRGV
jgi:hypothetical protein